MPDLIKDEESLTVGEQLAVGEKESSSKMFAKRVIAVFAIIAIAGVAYATSPLKQLPTYRSFMQLAAEPELSPDVPTDAVESVEQAIFEGLDEDKDSFVSNEEFAKFLKGKNSDKGLEGFRSMKFEDIDVDRNGKFCLKDFTYYLENTKDAQITGALKTLKTMQ